MPTLGPGSLQGGTDLEKHRDLLMVENERLRQDMRRCEAELQELRAKLGMPCAGCEHSQVNAVPGRGGGISCPCCDLRSSHAPWPASLSSCVSA